MFRYVNLLMVFLIPFIANSKMKDDEDYEVYVDEIVNQYTKEMKKEYGLDCIGSGGRMPKDVEEVGVMFTLQKKITSIEEARKIEVAAIQKLLKHINSHSKIRPFLREYPFKNDRVSVSISFTNKYNEHYVDGSITYMFQARSKIFYCSAETYIAKGYQITDPHTHKVHIVPDREDIRFVDYYDEPYEEAVKKVKNFSKN